MRIVELILQNSFPSSQDNNIVCKVSKSSLSAEQADVYDAMSMYLYVYTVLYYDNWPTFDPDP